MYNILIIFFVIFIILIIFFLYNRDTLPIIIKQIFFPSSKQENLIKLLNIAKNIPIHKYRIDKSINLLNYEDSDSQFMKIFKNITPISKSEMMKKISNTISNNDLTDEDIFSFLKKDYVHTYKNKYVISTTSGTSGEMGIFINDWESWVRTQCILFSNMFYENIFLLIPCFPTLKMVFILTTEGHFMTKKLSLPCFKILYFIDILVLSMFDKNLIKKINNYQPDILHTYSSVLEDIYLHLKISPKIITTGSEALSPILKLKLQENFKCKIISTYGSTECVFMATTCKHDNYHISDEVIIELVDDKGKLIEEENIPSDHILITNLINTYQPIIRYRLNDSLEYTRCACGSDKKTIVIHGRNDDCMYFTDIYGKIKKYSSITIQSIFVSIPEVFIFQVIHYEQNFLIIFIDSNDLNNITNSKFSQSENQDLQELKILIEINLNNFMIDNNLRLNYKIFYKKLSREKSGKFKQIINLVSYKN